MLRKVYLPGPLTACSAHSLLFPFHCWPVLFSSQKTTFKTESAVSQKGRKDTRMANDLWKPARFNRFENPGCYTFCSFPSIPGSAFDHF